MDKNRRVAVIGSGISGASAAWLLRDQADVTLLESGPRFGGHTHTYHIDGEKPVAVDTGFMVFNRQNYPLLGALFDHLGVSSYPTDMSFSASFEQGRMEYAGTDLNTLFGQRKNLVNTRFWGMLFNVVRFNRLAQQALSQRLPAALTLGEFLDRNGFNETFRTHYLYPMAAAIWSCPRNQIAQFPTVSFLRFFANHGLIRLADRPQWLTVEGGSSTYMDRLIGDLGTRARCNAPVAQVKRTADGVYLIDADGTHQAFDEVVFACHSDQALRLLADPSPSERHLLGAIPYQANRVLLHRDPALMPRERRVWSSWNYLSRSADEGAQGVSVTYWMNSLQRLATSQDYFVSLNPLVEPRDGSLVAEFEYEHPVFTTEALEAQRQLARIQGRSHTWYAGAWTGYGFHEDGMRSGVEVAQALGAELPWDSSRVQLSRDLTLVPEIARKAA